MLSPVTPGMGKKSSRPRRARGDGLKRGTPEYRKASTARHKVWAATNREHVRQYHRDYYAANREKNRIQSAASRARVDPVLSKSRARKSHLLRKYGLSPEDVDGMLRDQGGCCAICSLPFDGKTPHVDHDHTTGIVRGLLCARCNVWLGRYEMAGVVAAAERYLQGHCPRIEVMA